MRYSYSIISYSLISFIIFNLAFGSLPSTAQASNFDDIVRDSHMQAHATATKLLNSTLQKTLFGLIKSDGEAQDLIQDLNRADKQGSLPAMTQLMNDIQNYGAGSEQANSDINHLLQIRSEQFTKLYDRVLSMMAQVQDVKGRTAQISQGLHQLQSRMAEACKAGATVSTNVVAFPDFATPAPTLNFGVQVLLGNNVSDGFHIDAFTSAANQDPNTNAYIGALSTASFAVTYGLMGGTVSGVMVAGEAALGKTLIALAAASAVAAAVAVIVAVVMYSISMGEAIDQSREISNGMAHVYKDSATAEDIRRYYKEDCQKVLVAFNNVDKAITDIESGDAKAKTDADKMISDENQKIKDLLDLYKKIDEASKRVAKSVGVDLQAPSDKQDKDLIDKYRQQLQSDPEYTSALQKISEVSSEDLAHMVVSTVLELGIRNSQATDALKTLGTGELNAIKTVAFQRLAALARTSYLRSLSQNYSNAMAVIKNDLEVSSKLADIKARADGIIAEAIKALFDSRSPEAYRKQLIGIESELQTLSNSIVGSEGKAEVSAFGSSLRSVVGLLK